MERLEWASGHVLSGRPASQILTGSCATIQELRDAHAKAAQTKVSYSKIGKSGKRPRRKIRVDEPTLFTCVVSLPTLTEDALQDPELRARGNGCSERCRRA